VSGASHATLPFMATVAVETQSRTRADYHRMAGQGLLAPDARTELLAGRVFELSPQTSWHAATVHLVAEALRPGLRGSSLRIQSPLALDEWSEPEPDLAVVAGGPRDYLAEHPRTALLVVEVAHSSLRYDRERKLPLYAQAGLPETWLLGLRGRCLDVYRNPESGRYRTQLRLRPGDSVSPLCAPALSIAVADLLLEPRGKRTAP
jgi:Uma2 family endonuclease